MADKIVQLVDANEDNIFPLSSDPNAAHITMTTTDPGEGSALGQNEFVAVYGGDPIIMDYSLSEINTGAKWIDGSAIYKKTINFGALPNNTTSSVAHGISNLGLIIKIEGAAWNGASSYTPLPNPSPGTAYSVEVYVNGANLSVYSGTDRSSFTTSYITLYYTKSS